MTCWITVCKRQDWHQVSFQKGSFTCRWALGIRWSRSELSLQGAPFSAVSVGLRRMPQLWAQGGRTQVPLPRVTAVALRCLHFLPWILYCFMLNSAIELIPFYISYVNAFSCTYSILRKKIEYLCIMIEFSIWPIYSKKVISLIKKLSCYYCWTVCVCSLTGSVHSVSLSSTGYC